MFILQNLTDYGETSLLTEQDEKKGDPSGTLRKGSQGKQCVVRMLDGTVFEINDLPVCLMTV